MADTVELRGPCEREVVDVLDAFAIARGLNRTQLVNAILVEWVAQRKHEHSVVARVTRVIPALVEENGKGRKA